MFKCCQRWFEIKPKQTFLKDTLFNERTTANSLFTCYFTAQLVLFQSKRDTLIKAKYRDFVNANENDNGNGKMLIYDQLWYRL